MRGILSAKKQNSLKECLICEMEKDLGIHLLNYFICKECEHEIVTTETDNSNYGYYLERLKKVREALSATKNKVH
ncbi:hypothetical protein J2S74_005468 [Evansella vedderi]|uniref:Uncharacterized protein n=1 Tax=Evansella vedderi TaxID=38282 RepID=A0ABU0A421_9BACI|nr:sigma factor G inhibitor Gin [Evansella vedderi]MDQ0258005.1 hypothetical protein [Evansella vedderi]